MEDYLRRAAIWPGASVIDDPGGLPVTRKEKWKNGKESMPQLFILWYNRPILMYGGQVNEGL